MNNFEKERIIKHLSYPNFGRKYQDFINVISKDGNFEISEYKLFQEQTLRKDYAEVNQALANNLITFNQGWEIITAMVGFDLMIKGFLNKKKKDEQQP